MFNPANIIAGDLVIKNIPENACYTSFTELLKSLPEYLGVQIPSTITNVIVSNVQPSSSQTTSIWFRYSNSGSFLGIYVFSQGAWHNIYPINSGDQIQIETFYSVDGVTPTGWTKVEAGDPLLPPLVVTGIISRDVLSPDGTVTQLFSAYFSGF